MSNDNKEFYDLLNSIVNEQTFSLDLCPGENAYTVSCKHLSTAQLKELVKTVVDSPLTQSSFNSTATKVFNQSLIDVPEIDLNIIDRLLFIIETRIHSLSPTMTITNEDKTIVLNFEEIRNNLKQQLAEHRTLFASSSATEGKISIEFGVALLETESKLNEEIYKDINPSVEDAEQLRKVIGDAFINEIAKAVQSVTIGEATLDLSTVTFKSRLNTIESLPASLIQKVIGYIENYKKVVDECLTVDGYTLPIDGSLFSLR